MAVPALFFASLRAPARAHPAMLNLLRTGC